MNSAEGFVVVLLVGGWDYEQETKYNSINPALLRTCAHYNWVFLI